MMGVPLITSGITHIQYIFEYMLCLFFTEPPCEGVVIRRSQAPASYYPFIFVGVRP